MALITLEEEKIYKLRELTNNKATVVTFGNFKGGTGKTTNSTMIAYQLAELGYRTLLIDADAQANATTLFLRTKTLKEGKIPEFKNTFMSAILEGDLQPVITNVKKNLDLIPSFSDFVLYPQFLESKFKDEQTKRVRYLSKLIDDLKGGYDFIFLDVPPTISIVTDSALFASDYVIVVLQTQERSLQGAEVFIEYLTSLVTEKGANLDTIGVLPVLMKNNAKVDHVILDKAKEIFGEDNVFENVVKNMERLKRFDMTGITDEDMHDRRVHANYEIISKEFIDRLLIELNNRE